MAQRARTHKAHALPPYQARGGRTACSPSRGSYRCHQSPMARVAASMRAALSGSSRTRCAHVSAGVSMTVMRLGSRCASHHARRAAVGSLTMNQARAHRRDASGEASAPSRAFRSLNAASRWCLFQSWVKGTPSMRDPITSRSMMRSRSPACACAHVLLPDAIGPHTISSGMREGMSQGGRDEPRAAASSRCFTTE